MLHDFVVGFIARRRIRHRRIRSRRAHAIHAAGHVDHEKRVALCGSVLIVIVRGLVDLRVARAALLNSLIG